MRRSLVRFRAEASFLPMLWSSTGRQRPPQWDFLLKRRKRKTPAIKRWSWMCRGTPCRPLRGLQTKPARSDGSMARHESKQHTHLRRVRRSAIYRQYYRRVSRPSAMRCGCKWCRPGLATAYIAILNLRTRFLASYCAFVCTSGTAPPMRKVRRMLAGCVLHVCDVARGLVGGGKSCI